MLLYARIVTERVEITKHRIVMVWTKGLLLGWFFRFEVTPLGGARAGPLRIASCAAGESWVKLDKYIVASMAYYGSTHGSLRPPGDSRLPWKPLYT
jgi:hypothetical protein